MLPGTILFEINATTRMRPVDVDDAAAIFDVVDANRTHLREWLPWLDRNRSAADVNAFLQSVIAQREAGRGAIMVIEVDNAICGVVGFNWIEPVNRVCEIGYWLAASHKGRGIMTACVRRLVQHAFEDLNFNRITLPAAVENRKSRAIPERLEFQKEGVLRQAEWLYDHFVGHVMYALTKSDWK